MPKIAFMWGSNSNTTFVKVKYEMIEVKTYNSHEFKYNIC